MACRYMHLLFPSLPSPHGRLWLAKEYRLFGDQEGQKSSIPFSDVIRDVSKSLDIYAQFHYGLIWKFVGPKG